MGLLVLIAVVGTSDGQHLQSSVLEITERAVELTDYQVDTTHSAFTKDIFGFVAVSENEGDAVCVSSQLNYCRCIPHCRCGIPCSCDPGTGGRTYRCQCYAGCTCKCFD